MIDNYGDPELLMRGNIFQRIL